MDAFDLIVIGTGTAAQVAAGRVREAGRSVAVIDHRPFGGTCALRGCDPKKVLVGAAEALDHSRRMRGKGVGVPTIAFTIPPIASVGLGEESARERGLKFRMQHQNASDWYTARRVAETVYGFKVLVEEQTDHILGAHLVGPNVDEVINLFALAIRRRLTASDLKDAIFAYPTGASDIGYML